ALRPLSVLPLLFWYQLLCGATVFLAGMGVLAFRPRENVTIIYAMTGFGLMLASSTAAIYSTRELAMAGELFYSLSLINQFGTLLFVGPFVSILWYYPQRIHSFPFGPVFTTIFMLCWLVNILQLTDSIDVPMRYPIFVGLLVTFALATIQWRKSHLQPLQRAILKWFLLAWLGGGTIYTGLHMLPLVLHREAVISQSLGWGVLVTIYLVIALGITRYRLFDLDRWVVTGWLWFLGGVAVIAFDALLVFLLDIQDQLSLAISLAIAGWFYFPVRQYLWSLFLSNRKQGEFRDMVPSLLTTLLNTNEYELKQEWRQLLDRLYSPLNIESIKSTSENVQLSSEGIYLSIPGFRDISGLQLSYANHGNRLFNKEDCHLAEAVHQLFCRIQEFREAFTNGAMEERRRLARDLHDDVGAKLLTLVYSASNDKQEDLARETLGELRTVIHNLESEYSSLATTMSELRMETTDRCKPRGVSLKWNQAVQFEANQLEARQHANLKRIVRETVTNALRHSDAKNLQIDVDCDEMQLILQISNDNVHFDEKHPHKPGRGMHNIDSRARELEGSAEWKMGKDSLLGGYTVRIVIPLHEESSSDE
ncbi:MAG: hypothetical protein OQK13_01490, partial [Gammaproteobacteria bacterium]|nr:hypothetical protein [Gammaproteobacteria bacterium]